MLRKASAMMTLVVDGPLKPTSASAKTNIGKAWTMSATRMMPALDDPADAGRLARRSPRPRRARRRRRRRSVVETSAIVRSIRGAAIMRDRMSMPETSVPNQCCGIGRQQAGAGRRLDGIGRDRAGRTRARSRLMTMTTKPKIMPGRARAKRQRSLSRKRARHQTADPRVEQVVEEVDDQEDEGREDGRDQHDGLERRVVGVDHQLDRVLAEPAPGEDGLDQHGAAEQEPELDADHGDDRRQRVAQRVARAASGATGRWPGPAGRNAIRASPPWSSGRSCSTSGM